MRHLAFHDTNIPGCFEVTSQRMTDLRVSFTKIFHAERFVDAGLPERFGEWYHTFSTQHVLRGLHFQTPPVPQGKLVFCLAGAVLDVGVDIRVGSPTYGEHVAVELTAEEGNGLYLPPGLAHGYYVTSAEGAAMVYGATNVYSPEHDGGISWDSAGVCWPSAEPVLSERDMMLPSLADYDSPFVYEGEGR